MGFLKELRHPGVIRIVRNGRCTIFLENGKPQNTLYHISDLESDVVTLEKFLDKVGSGDYPKYGAKFLISVIQKILEPLSYCHSQEVLHLDLHWGNILLSPTIDSKELVCDKAVLIDFGKAKHMNPERLKEAETIGGGSYYFKHPDLRPYIKKNRVEGSVFSGDDACRFDLFSVAEGFKRLYLGMEDNAKKSVTAKLVSKVIEALRNEGKSVEYGISDALDALRRSTDTSFATTNYYIRLAGQVNVTLYSQYVRIIDSPEFQRLRRVYQLGLTSLVYPSATHSRFSHSIGVFDMSGQYIENLFLNSPEYRFAFDQELETSLRLAALVHDIGHYPFAHYFEELGTVDGVELNFSHGYYTKRILENDLGIAGSNLIEKLKNGFGDRYLDNIERVYNTDCIKEILHGPIDCDKVDYLLRDGVSCGVPYASSIDKKRLLGSLVCKKVGQESKLRLEITPKGIAPVETVIIARYQLFSEVYWHKVCRSVAAMVKHAMYLSAINGIIKQADLDHAVMHYDDWELLVWLGERLSMHDKDIADDLIRASLLDSNRCLYKRLITISHIWEGDTQDSAYTHLDSRKLNNYKDVMQIQGDIVEGLNYMGKQKLDGGWVNIKNHELLLDVPPADKDVIYFPQVYYETDVKGNNHYDFNQVSGIVKDTHLLKKTQKIRIFIHPRKIKQLRNISNIDSILRSIVCESK